MSWPAGRAFFGLLGLAGHQQRSIVSASNRGGACGPVGRFIESASLPSWTSPVAAGGQKRAIARLVLSRRND